jgi:hypothetical protein
MRMVHEPVEQFEATWLDLADIMNGEKILYPPGVLELILAEESASLQ